MKNQIFEHLLESCKSENEAVITFLHNTKSKTIAKKIMEEGFEYNGYIDYSTDVVSVKDPLTIQYFTYTREAYGAYTMVLQIAREIIFDISDKLKGNTHHYSEALTISKPYLNEDQDPVYKLAPHFVKGYFNQAEKKFYRNPNFDPSKSIPAFEENLKQLLKS